MDATTPTRILVVDDEAVHMQLLCDALKREGYEAVGFSDGVEALAAFGQKRYQLLITDLKMPAMDGISLLRAAKKIDPRIMGVVMTGQGSIQSAVDAMKAGAQDYILKPFSLHAVLQVISRVLDLRQAVLENEELTQNLRRQAIELEAANRELESFSYSVSHDLKQPLRAISGFSKLLQDEYGGKLDGTGARYLAYIGTETRRMAEILDDLLTLASLSRADLRREPLDLTALAHGVIEALQRRDPTRACTVEIEAGLRGQGDARLVTILLENLLGNAWKFTAKRSDTRIRLDATREAGAVTFHVSDNGSGFDPRYAKDIFTPFHRQHSTEEFEGTGIGLSIVERIVQKHGGKVWAEAEPGRGARFHFTLGTGPEA